MSPPGSWKLEGQRGPQNSKPWTLHHPPPSNHTLQQGINHHEQRWEDPYNTDVVQYRAWKEGAVQRK